MRNKIDDATKLKLDMEIELHDRNIKITVTITQFQFLRPYALPLKLLSSLLKSRLRMVI